MPKKTLFKGIDLARVCAGFDIENDFDFMFAALAVWILSGKLNEYDVDHFQGATGVIQPKPIDRGIRMILYRPEAEKWRSKHKKGVTFLEGIARDNDFDELLRILGTGIQIIGEFLSLL